MENTPTTKKLGRPRKPEGEVKRHNVTVVMTAPMRDKIRDAAEANGRSVSSEIDFRLGLSLALESDSGSISTRRLLDFARLAAVSVENNFNTDWTEDTEAASALIGALEVFIRAASPELPEVELMRESDREFNQLADKLAAINKAAKANEPGATKQLTQTIADFLGHFASRETIEAKERQRRLAGARMVTDLMRLIVGERGKADTHRTASKPAPHTQRMFDTMEAMPINRKPMPRNVKLTKALGGRKAPDKKRA